ncbi:hypothetical protein DFH08DRAFT_704786 [Mycena albidolilacea]|uniref:deuterolysin n=1 Tax=Mycena albidolilacea TaxID=1033008 RepID=A0AAD6ZU11_9AGAR|nr:hypothetical protein DFH08DRAFT_704786 [Mycena albidolilacea]
MPTAPAVLLFLGLLAFVGANPLQPHGLTVSIAGPTAVTTIADLELTAHVTNTGPQSIKILKYSTVLDDLPTRSFAVTKDNTDVEFLGIKASAISGDATFVTIGAGETVTIQHKVASLYDFSGAGTGSYTFIPITSFQVVSESTGNLQASAIPTFLPVEASSTSHLVHISGTLVDERALGKRVSFQTCADPTKLTFMNAAYKDTNELAYFGLLYILTYGGVTSEYLAYLEHTGDSANVMHFSSDSDSLWCSMSCTDDHGACGNGVIAYTWIATKNIYFCPLFFTEVPSTTLCQGDDFSNRDIRGGTVLREVCGRLFIFSNYGCALDTTLPDNRVDRNADNYNCFSTLIYQRYYCTRTGPFVGVP